MCELNCSLFHIQLSISHLPLLENVLVCSRRQKVRKLYSARTEKEPCFRMSVLFVYMSTFVVLLGGTRDPPQFFPMLRSMADWCTEISLHLWLFPERSRKDPLMEGGTSSNSYFWFFPAPREYCKTVTPKHGRALKDKSGHGVPVKGCPWSPADFLRRKWLHRLYLC